MMATLRQAPNTCSEHAYFNEGNTMLYFIRCGAFVRVEREASPERVLELRAASPYEVELLGTFDASDAEESLFDVRAWFNTRCAALGLEPLALRDRPPRT
jgi:hypothetical protein